MTESFLHYIWQHQYFNKKDLQISSGEQIQIIKQGLHNSNAGPDFSEAKIKIENIDWAGSVEIHIKSSDYLVHKHQLDKAYDNVILHVVWDHDKELKRNDGTAMPTLELKSRIDEPLLKEYKTLINSAFQIPCSNSFSKVADLVKVSMVEQALIQRLNAKSDKVKSIYQQTKGDWEETFYQVLSINFGFKVNGEAFHTLAKVLPLKVIRKVTADLWKKEALLFGMAGFLEEILEDEYHQSLKKEFKFLSHKHGLEESKMHKAQWKFLRLRPANFPTIRIAQLATMLSSPKIFSEILEATKADELKKLLVAAPSAYWQKHFSFAKKSKGTHHKLGELSIENIIINTVVPVLVAYSFQKGEEQYFNRALDLLQQLKSESNSITRQWQSLGLKLNSAFDSQGLIEQMNSNCKKRNCLNCAVGSAILKPSR